MDGIVVLLLIAWVVSQMKSKKNKKTKAHASFSVNKQTYMRSRADYIAKMREEFQNKQTAAQTPLNEMVLDSVEGEKYEPSVSAAEEAFRGSMQMESTEGECVCEPELEHEREVIPPKESVYSGEIGRESLVDFSARGLMQGFVMSEILSRPSSIRARKR